MPDSQTAAEAQEADATGHYISAELCGETVEMVPGGAWRQSAMRALRDGDFDRFFESVMSPASYERYLDLDPTNDEVAELMETAGASGEAAGKTSGPRQSPRPTRKR
ncbi:hypothetical protein [Streptomyces sp. NRRL F-5630]|uniref:hypothetical protein n=1 Tax=Streptomyces sp. NRRL F-5630 TaxID=1463864 RepID=UPI003EBD1B8C